MRPTDIANEIIAEATLDPGDIADNIHLLVRKVDMVLTEFIEKKERKKERKVIPSE